MDWQKVIFEETGEKFATHCKIWKSALARFEVSQSDSVSILSTISNRSVESEARLNERSILDYFFEEEIEETGKSSEKISTIRENEVKLAQVSFRIFQNKHSVRLVSNRKTISNTKIILSTPQKFYFTCYYPKKNSNRE